MNRKPGILFWIMLVVGLACSLVLLFGRIVAEERSDMVACAITYDDVLLLSATDGRPVDSWLKDLTGVGISYVVITDENEAEGVPAAKEAGMNIGRAGDTAREGDAFLMPTVPDRGTKDYEIPDVPGGDSSVPLALIENYTRTGIVMSADFDPDSWDGPMVKALYMYDAYSYHYQPAEPASENENILFRAVTDRSMRLIIVTPLEYEGGGVVADPTAYADMLGGLSERIADRGLTLGEDFSALDAPHVNKVLLAGAVLLLAALAVLFLCLIFSLPPLVENLLLLAGVAVSAVGGLILPALMQKLAAFGGAVLAPCFTALLLCRVYKRGKIETPYTALRFIESLAALLGISIAGGLYVAALLSTRQYMLEFSVFAGVKLAHIVPLAVTAALLIITLRTNPAAERRKVPPLLIIVIFAGVAAALVLMLLRSGDNMIQVAQIEITVRTWLEHTLYARPRTKEMLIAFPALALFAAACTRQVTILVVPLGVLAEVGSVSVVNTFCHTFTAVKISFIRTLLGAGIGFVIGLIVLVLFCAIIRPRHPESPTQPPNSASER